MIRRLTTFLLLACLVIVISGCSLLGISKPTEPTPTPSPTPRPTIPPEQILELEELDDKNFESGDVFTIRVTEDYVIQNAQDLAKSYEGITLAGSQIELEPDLIRLIAQVAIEDVDATIQVTLEGMPQIVDGMVYFQIQDLQVGEGGSRSLTDVLLEKTIEEALEDISTEDGIHLPLEEADELAAFELTDVRVNEGEILLTCKVR